MTCPSRFEIARLDPDAARAGTTTAAAAEAPPEVRAHLASCVRCRTAVAELRAARLELLGDDVDAAARVAARTLLAVASARRRARRGRFWRRILAGALPATALVAAVMVLRVAPQPRTVRAKGDLTIELYCKRGETVFPAQDGGDFLSGDRLRFAYTTAESGYLVVFGVDDRGAIFPYYPERDLRGVKVPAGEKVLLPGSIELDAHRGWERTFAIWSRAPFDDAALRARVGDGLRSAAGDVRRAGRLALDAPQVSYLLRRP